MQPLALARILGARAGIAPVPHSLGFELTHLCNLACTYCDRHTPSPTEMSREQILGALAQFVELGTRVVSLDGGEPLTHPHVHEIAAFLVQHGVTVHMNTNGILVPKRLATIRLVSRVKISLDGPRTAHDRMRGAGAFDKAMAGIDAAREAGAPVELTCVIGLHNYELVDELLDFVEARGLPIVFQPVRPSLFLDNPRDGSSFVPAAAQVRRAFERVEARKRAGSPVHNRWSSLRHFRRYPEPTPVPCAAGIINVTLGPEGDLHHCGQVSRAHDAPNVVEVGAGTAFDRLLRRGCSECWCARVVEENLAWGGRFDQMLEPAATKAEPIRGERRHLPVV